MVIAREAVTRPQLKIFVFPGLGADRWYPVCGDSGSVRFQALSHLRLDYNDPLTSAAVAILAYSIVPFSGPAALLAANHHLEFYRVGFRHLPDLPDHFGPMVGNQPAKDLALGNSSLPNVEPRRLSPPPALQAHVADQLTSVEQILSIRTLEVFPAATALL